MAGRDFPQREHGWLVVLQFDHGIRAMCYPAGALRRDQDHFKDVVDIVEAVLYRDTCHVLDFL
jgi:hypothetical protein